MGDDGWARRDHALTQLLNKALPVDVDQVNNPNTLRWLNNAIEKAKKAVYAGENTMPADVNSAQDLIKRKLLRENTSPEKAAKFSNLYSRLLSLPVLNQKWRILYLMYCLSEDKTSALTNGTKASAPTVQEPEFVRISRREALQAHVRHERGLSEESASPSRRDSVEPLTIKLSPQKREPLRPFSNRNTASPSVRPRTDEEQNRGAELEQELDVSTRPSELDLLRDIPFNLQGLSSASYKFDKSDAVQLPASLSVPVLSLLNTLAEPCLLYKSLQTFTNDTDGGLINQSLRAAISEKLRSYLSLVSTVESEIRRATIALQKGDDDVRGVRMAGVTLRRCVIWIREPTMALRIMSLIVEGSRNRKGGQLISLINSLLYNHGDPFVAKLAEDLLTHVCRPFYEMLGHWIYDGELNDPFDEFFITEMDPNAKRKIDPRRVATSVWENKYTMDESLVPSVITPAFAKKVFSIGKSLNFIRHNCGDSDWVIAYSAEHSQNLNPTANAAASPTETLANLMTTISEAHTRTMSRLTHLMNTKYQLQMHLGALKSYLLLSRGDFIALLVSSLASNLDRPAHSQYRHTLTSQLEHAVRHSNAQYDDPEVLSRLDARMVELSRGDTGWDCFTLEYKVSAPCDVIITQWANTQYLKVFNVLFRIKRVEYALGSTWRKCMTGARGVLADNRGGRADVNYPEKAQNLNADWLLARSTFSAMVHFVNQLLYYILFEVIETAWSELQQAMSSDTATLDDLIEAHTRYIHRIVQKGLLASSAEQEYGFLVQLHGLLKIMLSYREAVEQLYSFSVAEYTKRQAFSKKIEQRTAAGKWGINDKDFRRDDSRSSTPAFQDASTTFTSKRFSGLDDDDAADSAEVGLLSNSSGDDASILKNMRARMKELGSDFKARINNFLYDLAHQSDHDLRFLGVVMNYNESYKPTNPKRQARREKLKREARDRTAGTESRATMESKIGDVTNGTFVSGAETRG